MQPWMLYGYFSSIFRRYHEELGITENDIPSASLIPVLRGYQIFVSRRVYTSVWDTVISEQSKWGSVNDVIGYVADVQKETFWTEVP